MARAKPSTSFASTTYLPVPRTQRRARSPPPGSGLHGHDEEMIWVSSDSMGRAGGATMRSHPHLHLRAASVAVALAIVPGSFSAASGPPAAPSAPLSDEAANHPRSGCPVTSPNGRGLPGAEHPQGNHGDGSGLATSLWSEGTVTFKPGGPGCVAADGSLLMKWPWWRGVRGSLAVRGRRLDGASGAVRAAIQPYGEAGFQPSALVFPGPGCWEVTGQVAEASLSFVVLVEKVAEGPASPCEALFPRAALRTIR